MWSEEMDKKIRAAAENDIHGYDDKAWQNMETLLEKHLPQTKTRRRIILFLLIGLLVAGIPTFFILRKTSSESNPVVQQTTEGKNNTQPGSTGPQQKSTTASPINNNNSQQSVIETNTDPVTSVTNDKTTTSNSLNSTEPSDKEKTAINNDKVSNKTTTIPVAPANDKPSLGIKIKNSGVAGRTKTTPAPDQPQSGKPQPENESTIQNDIASNKPVTTTDKKQDETIALSPAIIPVTTEQAKNEAKEPVKPQLVDSSAIAKTDPVKKDRKKNSFASKFSISFSAGPDLSSVGTKTGKWKSQYGVGIGYAISDKWSVRTGFYVARKIYTADTNSYKTPLNSGTYLFKLDRIDANCLVYEVPVSVVYNFTRSNKHNWFVSGGISSYFMRSEKYDYIYKYQNMSETHKYAFKNENKHLFSVINLSGGYQYHFNNRLSLMAEPYLKVPVSGIGHGEVKLNSAGILFTLGYRPFQKR